MKKKLTKKLCPHFWFHCSNSLSIYTYELSLLYEPIKLIYLSYYSMIYFEMILYAAGAKRLYIIACFSEGILADCQLLMEKAKKSYQPLMQKTYKCVSYADIYASSLR